MERSFIPRVVKRVFIEWKNVLHYARWKSVHNLNEKKKKKYSDMILLWAGIWVLISSAEVPAIHVGFLPYIAKPDREYSTVYIKAEFCKSNQPTRSKGNKSVLWWESFRIALDIHLQKKKMILWYYSIASRSISKDLT